MKIFNTLTRRKEELKTLVPNELKVYACGPTVYNFIHIGNARPLCVFDTFRTLLILTIKSSAVQMKRVQITKQFLKNILKNSGLMQRV